MINYIQENDHLLGQLEALLFTVSEPIDLETISKVLELDILEAKKILEVYSSSLQEESRGLALLTFNEKFQLATKEKYGSQIIKFYKPGKKRTLTNAALETLLIVALNQPVLKAQIEKIRGVKSDTIITKLLDFDLIKIHDRLDTLGRPYRYSTTDEFLKTFQLESLEELKELLKRSEDDTHEN